VRPNRGESGLMLVITGPVGSGRTTVATIVARALADAGADVVVKDTEEFVERLGPLTGKKIRVVVLQTPKPGAPVLHLVKK